MTNLISCSKGTKEESAGMDAAPPEATPAIPSGRINQEQCWQRAQLIFKCALCLLIIAPPLFGQVPSPSNSARTDTALPESPRRDFESSSSSTAETAVSTRGSAGSVNTVNNNPADLGHQTKRILFVMPNFRAVSAGSQLPPQSRTGKLLNATKDSFDYSSFIFIGALAGIGASAELYTGISSRRRWIWTLLLAHFR